MIRLPLIDNLVTIDFDVILLGLNWYREKDPRLPLGFALIAAYTSDHIEFTNEANLHLLNYDVRTNLALYLHELININPRILGIGVMFGT